MEESGSRLCSSFGFCNRGISSLMGDVILCCNFITMVVT